MLTLLQQEFNALTANYLPGTPIPCLITVRPDRSFHFTLRTPPTSTLLLLAAGVSPTKNNRLRGANAPGRVPAPSAGDTSPTHVQASGSKNLARSAGGGVGLGIVKEVAKAAGADKGAGHGGGSTQVGEVSLKHIFEIAKIKQSEARLSGMSMEGLCRSIVAQARSVGVGVVP